MPEISLCRREKNPSFAKRSNLISYTADSAITLLLISKKLPTPSRDERLCRRLTHINKEKIMSSVQSWPCVWSESHLCNHWPTYSTYSKSSLICCENLVCYCDFLSNENTQRHTTWVMATKEALHWGRTWILAGFVSVTELKEGFVVSNRIQEQHELWSSPW